MKSWKKIALWGLFLSIIAISAVPAIAAYRRHYYGAWSYHPTNSYYYRSYYYQPVVNYNSTAYSYHYCTYYPTQPTYVYYYNPYSQVYWGRYDTKAEGYSMLDEKDRKKDLKDIPDSAFPKPGEMPAIPESKDGEKMAKIAADDLPAAEAPKDAPGGKK